MGYPAFSPTAGGTISVSATASSQTIAVPMAPATGPWQCVVYNAATVIAFIREGTGTAVVGTDMPVPPSSTTIVTFDNTQSVGVILASSTGTVYLTPGVGY